MSVREPRPDEGDFERYDEFTEAITRWAVRDELTPHSIIERAEAALRWTPGVQLLVTAAVLVFLLDRPFGPLRLAGLFLAARVMGALWYEFRTPSGAPTDSSPTSSEDPSSWPSPPRPK